MYIIKNAIRCISRSKGRSALIAVIALVIAVAACIGLSMRQGAETAREELMEELTITGTISFDRQSMMNSFRGETPPADENEGGEDGQRGSFDRNGFAEKLGEMSSLTLEEYQTYANAESVQDFYWTLTVSANGNDDLSPVSASTDEESGGSNTSSQNPFGGTGGMQMPGGMGGGRGMFTQGDFQLVGYSSEDAMEKFIDGTASITDGAVFEEGTENFDCIISQELALYNEIQVGDSIVITSLENEEETYILTVVGLFTDSSANEMSFSMGGFSASDPANQIYMSYQALQKIVSASEEACAAEKGEESEYSPLTGSLDGTYLFADVEHYEAFEKEVRELGLDDSYTVSSQDLANYENSLTPLETLSTTAGWFLLVILAIGAVILIVLNIFNVRERKYEIGVLCAMGMKKGKVAMQFLTEIFIVTLCAVAVGVVIGGICAVPVTNAFLANQSTAKETQTEMVEQNFGRGGAGGDMQTPPDMDSGMNGGRGGMQMPENFGDMMEMGSEYIAEIDSAMNLTVVFQMFGIALLLTLAGGLASMLFIMRYEPLKILSNRD